MCCGASVSRSAPLYRPHAAVPQGDDVKDFYLGTNGPWQSEEVVHVTDISDPDDDGNRFATANLKLILDMDRLLQVCSTIGV